LGINNNEWNSTFKSITPVAKLAKAELVFDSDLPKNYID
jgi:hypothetical protein